jgi:hypothetical protein
MSPADRGSRGVLPAIGNQKGLFLSACSCCIAVTNVIAALATAIELEP